MTDKNATATSEPTPIIDDKTTGWWIVAEEQDADFLKGLGIVLGPYLDGCFYECVMGTAEIDLLEPHWGRFMWGSERGIL